MKVHITEMTHSCTNELDVIMHVKNANFKGISYVKVHITEMTHSCTNELDAIMHVKNANFKGISYVKVDNIGLSESF